MLLYFQERLRLLQSIESLLLVGEGWLGAGAFVEAIEETLGTLLGASPDLEEVTFQALKDNLEGNHSGAVPGCSAALLGYPMSVGGGGSFSNRGALVGFGDSVLVPGMTATLSGRSAAAEDLAALERNILLSILSLIYFYPRKQCTQQRFLELARLFHAHLFAIPLPQPTVSTASSSPSRISVKLATLLLLEVLALDVDKALQVIARGEGPIKETTNAFLAPSTQNEINNELRTWYPASSAPHAAIILVWAAVLTLADKHEEAFEHAAKATGANALGALRDLSSPQGLQPAAVDMAGTIVYSAACTVLTAFTLDPCNGMSAQQAQQAVDMLCNIFSHHPALCDSFWNGNHDTQGHQNGVTSEPLLANQPIRSFLDSLSSLFPAYPLPLLRLLTALTAGSGPTSAAAAFFYLSSNTELTWLHQLPHPAIAASSENALEVVTTTELDLPGTSKGLTLYNGVVGEVLTSIDSTTGMCGAWPVWIPGWSGSSAAAVHAVKWHLPAEVDTRPWTLLCRSFGALRAVQEHRQTANSSIAEAALLELDASLSFLAAVCSRDPGATAIHILRFEAPSGTNGSGGGSNGGSSHGMGAAHSTTGRDVISLACQTIGTLADLSVSLSSSTVSTTVSSTLLTSCFKICTAFASVAGGRVTTELLGALGITPLDVAAFARSPASPPEAPILKKLISSEGATANYPSIQAILQLLISLLQAGCPSPALAPLVSFVLQRIAPEINHWKYENNAEKWLIAERCLTVVRQALLVAPNYNHLQDQVDGDSTMNTNAILAAVTAVLQSDSGVTACLFPLLPPDAAVLEAQSNSADCRTTSQVEAAEKCCIAWLRLIPVLLPPNNNGNNGTSSLLAPTAFLCARLDASRPPAAILLSFLAYPYFAAREKALVVRAMHCFVHSASSIVPDMPLLPLLPEDCGAGVAPAAKAALVDALAASIASSCEPLFEATCDVLAAVVMKHPSLVDALFFESNLERTNGGKENKGANNLALLSSTTTTTNATTTYSCLDALWSLLQRWESLLNESPFALAKAMHVISSLWQSGGPGYRAISVLQRQPGFWAVIVGILESSHTNRGAGSSSLVDILLENESLGGGVSTAAGSGLAAAEKWVAMKKDCWKIAAETAAMHILAAECFAWSSSTSGGSGGGYSNNNKINSHSTMPFEVYEFVVQGELQALVPRLLERYCLVLPHVSELERDAARLATATAAQLLEISFHDQALWASIQAGPCLVSKLALITEPELQNCKDQAQIASHLHAIATAALGASGDQAVQSRPVLRALADCLLIQAEIPQRLAPTAHYGSNYIYDSSLLGRRIGAALAQVTPLLSDLKNMLAAVSVAFSLEDVRADAASALDALVAVADTAASHSMASTSAKQKKQEGTINNNKAEIVQDVAIVLKRVVETALASTIATTQPSIKLTAASVGSGGGNGEMNASSLKSLHLASAAAAAQIALVIIRTQRSGSFTSSTTRATHSPFAAGATPPGTAHLPSSSSSSSAAAAIDPVVLETVLSLTAKWLESSVDNNERDVLDAISKCLLAASLDSVSFSSTSSLSTTFSISTSAGEGPAHHAAQRLLPALLTIISNDGNNNGKQHAEAAASLCAALLNRLVPQDVWLPVLRQHLHFGRAIGTALEAMNHASTTNIISTTKTNKEEACPEEVNRHGAILEALLLLALQVTQSPSGSLLLIEQGVPPLLLSLASWLQSPPPGGNLLGMNSAPPTNINAVGTTTEAISMFSINPAAAAANPSSHVVIDYSNAYSISQGTFSTTLPHRLWCSVLSLIGLLTATAPGAPAVVSTALQLVVGMDPRIQLAIEPPEGTIKQPVTLAMAQESRYALFTLYGVVKMANGHYRVALPHALPALRRASAALLRFIASMEPSGRGNDDAVVCVAVTEAEKALIRAPAPSTALGSGWFGIEACCTTAASGASGSSHAQLQSLEGVGLLNGFTWELAEQFYSCAQYALAFQLAVAPEMSEAEAENLGPEWPDATTLTTLCRQCIEIIDPACAGNVAAHPAVGRILKLMISILKLSLQLLDVMVPKGESPAKIVRGLMREAEAAVGRAQAILGTYSLT